jgi:hypothetical protein
MTNTTHHATHSQYPHTTGTDYVVVSGDGEHELMAWFYSMADARIYATWLDVQHVDIGHVFLTEGADIAVAQMRNGTNLRRFVI